MMKVFLIIIGCCLPLVLATIRLAEVSTAKKYSVEIQKTSPPKSRNYPRPSAVSKRPKKKELRIDKKQLVIPATAHLFRDAPDMGGK